MDATGVPLVLAATDGLSNLLAARLQMALTLGFHIVLACLGVGLPVLLLFAESRFLRTADELWKVLARRWSKAFAVLFAVGAVSGTVLSFELGLLWPEFMGRFGGVIGLPFTLEAFAFFIEAIFAGIYLYGWDRLPPRVHWWCGVPIAVAGFASAWFVVSANAWMNIPQGFRMEDGKVVEADPLAAMLNPATPMQTTHMIVAAYMVTGFVVAGFYALRRLCGDDSPYNRRGMALGLVLGVVFAPVQVMVGDWAAHVVADSQPIKLAAMEGQFETERGAPLRIGGLPDEATEVTGYAIEVPGMLSWLAYGDSDATVRGLKDFPSENRPPVLIVHLAFQLMVASGMWLLMMAGWTAGSWIRSRELPGGRLYLGAVVASAAVVVLAMQAGWVVTEVGRQPWIVQGVMRTSEAATTAPGVWWIFGASLVIYAILFIGLVIVLRLLARQPIHGGKHGP